MRKILCILTILFVAISAFGAGAQEDGDIKSTELNCATASMGGAFYPMGQAIGTILTTYIPNVSVVPVVTGGSVANPRTVSAGEHDIGITNADKAYAAIRGDAPYDGVQNISGLIGLHPSILHVVVLDGSDVNSFNDFKGKKIAAGTAGGGTIAFLKNILPEYGFDIEKDMTASFLSYNDGMSQLSDKNLDISCVLAGYPTSAVTQTITTKKINLVPIEDEIMDTLIKKYPYYKSYTIPASLYKLDNDATVIGVPNVLIVRDDLDEELVYQMAKALYENLTELGELNAAAKKISKETIFDLPIKLHPGAQRFYDEIK